jgi:hypothetical protein
MSHKQRGKGQTYVGEFSWNIEVHNLSSLAFEYNSDTFLAASY